MGLKKNYTLDRGPKKTLIELAHYFIEETLDLSLGEKRDVTSAVINAHMSIKFPDISKSPSLGIIEHSQRRVMEL